MKRSSNVQDNQPASTCALSCRCRRSCRFFSRSFSSFSSERMRKSAALMRLIAPRDVLAWAAGEGLLSAGAQIHSAALLLGSRQPSPSSLGHKPQAAQLDLLRPPLVRYMGDCLTTRQLTQWPGDGHL